MESRNENIINKPEESNIETSTTDYKLSELEDKINKLTEMQIKTVEAITTTQQMAIQAPKIEPMRIMSNEEKFVRDAIDLWKTNPNKKLRYDNPTEREILRIIFKHEIEGKSIEELTQIVNI